jgi:DNA-binding beta-propeller fold protein YncE
MTLGGVGLVEPAGMAFDPTTRELYVLDAARGTLVRLSGGRFSRAADLPLPPELAALTDLRGLALEPGSGSFYLVSPAAGELYEVDRQGSFRSLRQLPELGAFQLLAMTFAASWDTTDEPERTHLYLATSDLDTGSILVTEWTFTPRVTNQPRVKQPSTLQQSSALAQASAPEDSSLLQTIEAWRFDPPSPDSAGIAYQPSTGTMLMSDSEVNEMDIYEGVNVFEHDRFGTLLDTFDTTDFSNEPTGVAVDPANGHCFFSDDTGDRSVYVVDPGSDGLCVTSDDSVTRLDTESFGSNDPEGVAFCQGSLFVSDGQNDEFYEIRPGSNGTFGDGDDAVTSCDTFSLGVENPEGITCNESTGQIFLVGKPDDLVTVAQQNCQIVATIDISEANAKKPAGLGLGPSSVNPGQRSLWITARGVDNGKDPNENDGLIYEMSLPPGLGGNSAPVVQAGPDQTINLGEVASLQGSVVDDGVPGPFTSQ